MLATKTDEVGFYSGVERGDACILAEELVIFFFLTKTNVRISQMIRIC